MEKYLEPDNMKEKVISVNNLILKHGTKKTLTFDVNKGEIIAVTGENGTGKTTLLRYLAGLERTERENVIKVKSDLYGELDLSDENILPNYHRICGMVFQNPEEQFVFSDILDDIYFGPENLGIRKEEITRRTEEILAKICLTKKAEYVNKLSGGEKQRLAVGDLWVMEPQILILDEISSMQQALNREDSSKKRDINEVFQKIIDWARENDRTLIFTSHRENEIKEADRVIDLSNNKPFENISKGQINLSRKNTFEACKIRISEYVNQKKNSNKKIEMKNVSFSYGKNKIIDNISMEFYRGRLYFVSGETGSGKSTLGMLLNRLLSADYGTISVEGTDILDKKIKGKKLAEIRRKIGYVMQYPEKQLFCESVIKDVMYGPLNMGYSISESKNKAIDALKKMGVSEELWNRSVRYLSGGEKRRVAISGILSMEPDYLILDEPFAGIDENGRNLLVDIMNEYVEADKCVVLISHDGIDGMGMK